MAAGLLAAVIAVTVSGITAVTILWLVTAAAWKSEAEQRQKTEGELAAKLIALARVDWEANNIAKAAGHLRECPEAHRDPEWLYLDRMCRAELFSFAFPAEPATRIAYAPNGQLVAAVSRTDLRVWNTSTRSEAFAAQLERVLFVKVGFTPDGGRVGVLSLPPNSNPKASLSGAPYFQYQMWDTATGRPTADSPITWPRRESPPRVGVNSPTGLAAVVDGPMIRVINRVSGSTFEFAHGHRAVQYLELNTSGTRILSTGAKEPIKVWDTSTGRVLYSSVGWTMQVPSLELYLQMFSPDGRFIVQRGAGEMDEHKRIPIMVWDLEHDRELATIRSASALFSSNRLSPDGRHIATLDGRVVRVWDLKLGREVFVLRGHANLVLDTEFSPDGLRLASVGQDNTVRVWDISPLEE